MLDSFIDGVIDRFDRDRRLSVLDSEDSKVSGMLLREQPSSLTAESLASILEPFLGWMTLSRDEKRTILSVTAPEIRVADYRIEGLYLNSRSNEVSHTDAAYDVATRLYIPLGIELR